MTAIILSTAELGVTSERQFQSDLAKTKAENAISGVIEISKSRGSAQTLDEGTFSTEIGGRTITYSLANNDATLARTYNLTSTISIGDRNYQYARLIEGRQPAHPSYYAVFAGGNLVVSDGIETTQVVSGGVHSNSSISINSSSLVNGDLTAVSGISDGAVGTGQTDPSAKPVSGGLVSNILSTLAAQYLLGADTVRLFDTELKGMSFPNPSSAVSPYHLRYYAKGITMNGAYSGTGTIVVLGNLDIDKNVTYSTAASRMVVIVGGNMTVSNAVANLAGCYFVCGNLTVSTGRTSPLNVTGNLWTLGNLTGGDRTLRISSDRTFWNNRNEATRHKMPGFWPLVTTPGLLR